jgi:hypothetical protein
MEMETLELVGISAFRQGLVTGASGIILKAGAVAIISTIAVPTGIGTVVAIKELLKDPAKKPKVLFRAMADADDGGPVVSNDDGQYLGIRARDNPNRRQKYDIDFDAAGTVHPKTGGLSVTPGDPYAMIEPVLKRVARGESDIFAIYQDILPPTLAVTPDTAAHAFIEPAYAMPLSAYRDAIVSTRPFWVKVTP